MSRPYRKTVCGRCPKLQSGCCVRLAKIMVADHPACAIVRRLIHSRDNCRIYHAKKSK